MPKIDEVDLAMDELLPEINKIQKYLYARPELSPKVYKTSEFIRLQLSNLDIQVLPPSLSTDFLALLRNTWL